MNSFRRCLLYALSLIVLLPVSVRSQAPTINAPFPMGGQRGTTVDLTLTGKGLAGPTSVWTSFPAKVTIPTDKNNGKVDTSLRVRIEIGKDAPVGPHGIRLATERGVSNLRMFCVDDLPQVVEASTNNSPKTPQTIDVPCVVAGRADAEKRDYFKFAVKAGQRLTFEVLGRRLGGSIDPHLTLYDAAGRDLPGGYDSASPGRQSDPALVHTFAEAGEYLVEVRDISYRGGADYGYRLRIGAFPLATTSIPLAVGRGQDAKISFVGPFVEGVAVQNVKVPPASTTTALALVPRVGKGVSGWPVYATVSDMPEAVEAKDQSKDKPQTLAVPSGVSGRFEQERDRDHYVFAAKKGQRILIEAHTGEHGSPSEVYMVLRDSKGKQLQATDPAKPPRFDFKVAADGNYTIDVEHLHYWGGPTESYRLTLEPYGSHFSATVKSERLTAPQGGKAYIALTVSRGSVTGPITCSIVDSPLKGSVTLADKQTSVLLPIDVPATLPTGAIGFRIEVKGTLVGKPVSTLVDCSSQIRTHLGNLPVPPPTLAHDLVLAVTPKAPFTLTAKLDAEKSKLGKAVNVTVTAVRQPGFTEAITLTASPLPANVKAAIKPIPAKANAIKLTLTPAKNSPVGQHVLFVGGTSKHAGKTVTASSIPLTWTLEK